MDYKTENLVSIIIPCYNNELYVGEAIESALKQTYPNIEIVCYNDGSTDNSSSVIQKYADKYENINFIDEKINRGVCYAKNFAIEACNGEYILPLDADDKIEAEYVEKAVQVLSEKPNVGIVYCNARLFGVKNKKWKLPSFDKDSILYKNCIFNSALFRKKDFIKCGGYNQNMKYGCEDWDLWLSFVENGFEAYKINECLFWYRKIKQKSRTNVANNHSDGLLQQMVKNHINLYLNSDECYNRIFMRTQSNKKYKKLFNLFLTISIIELILILCFVFLG